MINCDMINLPDFSFRDFFTLAGFFRVTLLPAEEQSSASGSMRFKRKSLDNYYNEQSELDLSSKTSFTPVEFVGAYQLIISS